MTTFNPPLDLFKAQVDSLRGQTHGNWICLVSDDSSRPDVYAAIRDELDGDQHFVLSQTEGRLGYYRNFERVLGLVPAEAALVSLCDQDDRWHPNKLEPLRAALESGVTARLQRHEPDRRRRQPHLPHLLDRSPDEPH